MKLSLLLNAGLFLLILNSATSAATLSDELQKGKDYYFTGEFKRAISQFELALKADPSNPETYLWLGRSYELSADLKPLMFGARTRLKAQVYLAKALELAPESAEYRSELFSSLVTDDGSPSALRRAKSLLDETPESNPDYASMQLLLAQAQSFSPDSLLTVVFGAPHRALARLTQRKTLARNTADRATTNQAAEGQ
jgi:tetratricopeptide (TPR) repeat protein